MIDQIEISNVQSHKHSSLALHSRVNVIRGSTHSGKSSVIRAIKILLQNRPKDVDFKSDFAKKEDPLSVGMSFSEGSFISREKNPAKKVNLYLTSLSDEPIDTIGVSLPEEIPRLSGLGPENLQSQNERYFFLELSPGKVAKKLNEVVGLEIINEKQKKAKSIISKTKSRANAVQEEIEDAERKLKQYDYLDEALPLADEIDKLISAKKETQSTVVLLTNIIDRIVLEKEKIKNANTIGSLKPETEAIKILLSDRKLVQEYTDDISHLVESIKDSQDKVDTADSWIGKEEEVKEINELNIWLRNRRFKAQKIKTLYLGIENKRKSIVECDIRLKIKLKELSEAKELLDYCSECGAEREHWNLERAIS